MGDKAEAKRAAAGAGVPVLPGYAGDDQNDRALVRAAEEVGYPLIVKPAAGGGGKGMAVVREPGGLTDALAAARRVARAAFGDERLLLERFLDHPRHVEVQVVADQHGAVVHLGERDCSLQRRHQKILEEAPAPNLDADLRRALHEAAVSLARAVGYRGAGTCEFLLDADGTFGFIEMNARLQVEHPVTEAVTGLDLVELQLRVARGEPLPVTQDDVTTSGHAVEVRLYAEDPAQGFLPQAGRVLHLAWPEGVRVDAGIEKGTEVSTHYDPLLAKLIAHAPDRDAALAVLRDALGRTQILGPRTNLSFLAEVTAQSQVLEGRVTTDWLDAGGWEPSPPDDGSAAVAVAAAAEADRLRGASARDPDPWRRLGAWRPGGRHATRVVLRAGGEELVVEDAGRAVGGAGVAAVRDGDTWFVWASGRQWEIGVGPAPRRVEEAGAAHLGSPLPGHVVAVRVEEGQLVGKGDELVVVEAMKMEHAILAPADGVVTAVLCRPGEQVDRGQTLVDFEPS
jgi:acetyl/propionyl-CoA carboxylase alpha subunit